MTSNFKERLTKALGQALIEASSDYYRWSGGRVFYDRGVEAILTVYAAKHLFDEFGDEPACVVEVEHPTADILTGLDRAIISRGGRVDVSLALGPGSELAVVELKRYLNPAVIKSDVMRLAEITESLGQNRQVIGCLCGVMYQLVGYDHPFKTQYEANLTQVQSLFKKCHIRSVVSENVSLPAPRRDDRQAKHDRHLSIIVTVESGGGG